MENHQQQQVSNKRFTTQSNHSADTRATTQLSVPDINIDVSSLPSRGKCYPHGAKISYRGYLFGEITKVSASRNTSYDDKVKLILSGIKTNFDRNLLTLNDVMYLGIARKISTLGTNELSITHRCENEDCSKVSDFQFNQNAIHFNDLSIDGHEVELELSNGKTYIFGPLTVGGFFDLSPNGKYSKMYQDKTLLTNLSAVLASMVKNLTFKECFEDFYSATSADDVEGLNEINTLLHHDIKPLELPCPQCGHNNSIELEAKEALINPFRTGEDSKRNRVRVISKPVPVTLSHGHDGVSQSNVPT